MPPVGEIFKLKVGRNLGQEADAELLSAGAELQKAATVGKNLIQTAETGSWSNFVVVVSFDTGQSPVATRDCKES